MPVYLGRGKVSSCGLLARCVLMIAVGLSAQVSAPVFAQDTSSTTDINNHEQWTDNNVKRFEADIMNIVSKSDINSVKALADIIDLYSKNEEYIVKAQQASHPSFQLYGPIATAAVSALIAMTLAVLAIAGYFKPSHIT
jgi:hypothetical protein